MKSSMKRTNVAAAFSYVAFKGGRKLKKRRDTKLTRNNLTPTVEVMRAK